MTIEDFMWFMTGLVRSSTASGQRPGSLLRGGAGDFFEAYTSKKLSVLLCYCKDIHFAGPVV